MPIPNAGKLAAALGLLLACMLINTIAWVLQRAGQPQAAEWVAIGAAVAATIACLMLLVADEQAAGGQLSLIATFFCFLSIFAEMVDYLPVKGLLSLLRLIAVVMFFVALSKIALSLEDDDLIVRTRRMLSNVALYAIAAVVVVICIIQEWGSTVPLKEREPNAILLSAAAVLIFACIALIVRMIGCMAEINSELRRVYE